MVPFDPQFYALVVLPVFIFVARIADVSMGTLRIILISRGVRQLSTVIAFFEILIWLMAVSQIMSNLNNPLYYICYAGGFAAGTYIGIVIEGRLSIGNVILRVITHHKVDVIVRDLQKFGHKVTVFNGSSADGKVKLLFTIVKRRQMREVIQTIKKCNPNVFYSVEDVRSVHEKIFPVHADGREILRRYETIWLRIRNAKSN